MKIDTVHNKPEITELGKALHSAKILQHIIAPRYKLKENGDTRTPIILVNQCVNHIPESTIQRGGKFLDTCCGRGTFLVKLIERLLKYHSAKAISKMIYAIDINEYNVYTTKKLIANILKIDIGELDNYIVKYDFLTWRTDIEFDVIISNPPYSIYKDVMKKSLSVAKQVIMVVPRSWYIKRNKSYNSLEKLAKSSGLKSLHEVHNKVFKGINIRTGPCFFVAERGYTGKIKIYRLSEQVYEVNRDTELTLENPLSFSVLKKVEKVNPLPKASPQYIVKGCGGKLSNALKKYSDLSAFCSNGGQPVLLYGGGLNDTTDFVYTANEYITQPKWQVSIPVANSKDGKFGKIIKTPPGTLVSDRRWTYAFNTENEADNFIGYLTNTKFMKVITYITSIFEILNEYSLYCISDLDFTKPWTDADLYTYFNLTKEEIDNIEAFV